MKIDHARETKVHIQEKQITTAGTIIGKRVLVPIDITTIGSEIITEIQEIVETGLIRGTGEIHSIGPAEKCVIIEICLTTDPEIQAEIDITTEIVEMKQMGNSTVGTTAGTDTQDPQRRKN